MRVGGIFPIITAARGYPARSTALFFRGLGLVVLFLQFNSLPALSEPTVKAVKFYQSQYFLGPNILIVSKDGVRLENKGPLKFFVVSRAPDWKVTVFRNDDKIFFTESLSEFTETSLVSDILVGRKSARVAPPLRNRQSTYSFCGFNVIRLTQPYETFKYLPLAQVEHAPPQVERFVYGAYKMPTEGGIPIGYVSVHTTNEFMSGNVHDKGSRQVYFATEKIERVNVSPSLFNAPGGYKKAMSIREVVSGSTNRTESENLFDSLGTGEGSGSKKPSR